MVLPTRIELVFLLYQSSVLPFNYRSNGASGEIRTPITWFRRPGTAPSAEALELAEGGGIEPQPLQSPTVFEAVSSPTRFTFHIGAH